MSDSNQRQNGRTKRFVDAAHRTPDYKKKKAARELAKRNRRERKAA